MSPTSPRNGNLTLPDRCRFLPLLPPTMRNVTLSISTNPLQFSLCPHPSHESISKSGKNGNVDHPSQLCHNPLPPLPTPLVSLDSSLLPPHPFVFLRVLCGDYLLSSVTLRCLRSSVFVLISPLPRFGCGPLPRGVQYSGLRQ